MKYGYARVSTVDQNANLRKDALKSTGCGKVVTEQISGASANWKGANGFVLFGKGGEIASNHIADQAISAHALHLLQSSLVYVNTRMGQSVLQQPAIAKELSADDYHGLTPLIYSHINPYGRFEVDLEKRIDFERCAA